MKKIVAVFFSMSLLTTSFAQNLFNYGDYAVTKDEFVRAFNKNPDLGGDRKKALKDYLDLYINFKLKVQAAYDAGLDKDATQRLELQNFKKQIADNIINDQANIKRLVKEAFDRSQKEIRLQQIFIEVPANADTAEAYRKIQLAYKELKNGKDFGAVAQLFSSDDALKKSKGDLGFITAFSLPYNLENIMYGLKVNSFSGTVKTKVGYHIFKNAEERKSFGWRHVAQILVAIPSDATMGDKKQAAQKADSLYNLVKNGIDFGSLAASASNDLSSSNNRGELPWFTVGTYNADFENIAFSLKNNGDISKPFQTEYGFHILKLLEAKPAPNDLNDPAVFTTLEEKVTRDNRMELSKKVLIQEKLALIGFKPAAVKENDLFIYTDSTIHAQNTLPVKEINERTLLFSFAKQKVRAGDWVKFVKKGGNAFSINKDNFKQLYKEYVGEKADEYYRSNLDEYNSNYCKQLKEFKEANLLFGIMEKKVWGKANADTVGILKYFNQNKSKYVWPPSADVIIFTCNNEDLASEVRQKLKDSVNNWRQITGNYSNALVVDSGRYELSQLPVAEKTNVTPGLLTLPVKNQNDDTYTFNYIVKVYNAGEQRAFDDARGMVLNDYQRVLEDKWITELKKKYPIKVNQAVFQSIK